jgi:hypothetical protein
MPYYGVISRNEDTKFPFGVNITDADGRVFGTFPANTEDEAKAKLFDLLKTLREGEVDGLGRLNHRR